MNKLHAPKKFSANLKERSEAFQCSRKRTWLCFRQTIPKQEHLIPIAILHILNENHIDRQVLPSACKCNGILLISSGLGRYKQSAIFFEVQ